MAKIIGTIFLMAAIATIFTLWVQSVAVEESVRPELIISKFERTPNRLTLAKIRNAGKGAAINVELSLEDEPRLPLYVLEAPILLVVPAGEEIDLVARLDLRWPPRELGHRSPNSMDVRLLIVCRDARGNVYETRYQMTLHEFGMDEGMTRNRIAGITVATREVTNASDLRVSIGRWVQKLWK